MTDLLCAAGIALLAALAGCMALAALVSVAVGQVLFKGAVTLVSLPLIYAVPSKPVAETLAFGD